MPKTGRVLWRKGVTSSYPSSAYRFPTGEPGVHPCGQCATMAADGRGVRHGRLHTCHHADLPPSTMCPSTETPSASHASQKQD